MELIRLRTKIFKPNFDLLEGVISGLKANKQHLNEGDILIVNSKIVAVSQGRVVGVKSDARFADLVREEADMVISQQTGRGQGGKWAQSAPMPLTIKNGIFTPAAGIDRSNSPEGTVVLWPDQPWSVAWQLYMTLKKQFKMKRLGVVIVDSTCHPLRAGTSGVALAWAGFKGVKDERGKKDIYKKPLTITRKAVADNLASAAQILMGEADEQVPLVIVRNPPVVFTATKPKAADGTMPLKECLYSGLYKSINA